MYAPIYESRPARKVAAVAVVVVAVIFSLDGSAAIPASRSGHFSKRCGKSVHVI